MRVNILAVFAALSVLILSSATAAESPDQRSAEAKHAYFGFAFHYKSNQSTMQLGVCGILPEGPAAQAGLKMDDLILAVDGRSDFKSAFEVLLHLFAKRPGENLDFTVQREKQNLKVSIAGREATAEEVSRMQHNLVLAKEDAARKR